MIKNNNRSQKALNIFNKYKAEIDAINNIQEANTWKAKVLDSIKIYLGGESRLYTRFEESYFTVRRQTPKRHIPGVIDLTVSYEHVYDDSLKGNFKTLVQNIIDHITLNGIQQDYIRTNFLSGFSTTTIIGGLFSAATLIFFVGRFVGTTEKEREIYKIESQIQTVESDKKELEKELFELTNENSQLKSNLVTSKNKIDSLTNIQSQNFQTKSTK